MMLCKKMVLHLQPQLFQSQQITLVNVGFSSDSRSLELQNL